MSSTKQYERITCDEVEVGDRIGRTRLATFVAVESIDEGPATRRLHFAREACPEPPLSMRTDGSHAGRRFCAACHRWENSGDPSKTLVEAGHGQVGGGNIRPRRTAKLWREVAVSAPVETDDAPRYRVDVSLTIDTWDPAPTASEIADAVRQHLEQPVDTPTELPDSTIVTKQMQADAVEAKARRID